MRTNWWESVLIETAWQHTENLVYGVAEKGVKGEPHEAQARALKS